MKSLAQIEPELPIYSQSGFWKFNEMKTLNPLEKLNGKATEIDNYLYNLC